MDHNDTANISRRVFENGSTLFNTTMAENAYTEDDSSHEATTRFKQMRHIAYGFVLPTILALGILGNSIIIAIFSKKSVWRNQKTMEKSAMIGLLSLAAADLLFCVIGFPSAFMKARHVIAAKEYSVGSVIELYYTVYKPPLLNLHIFMSTWFIITLAVERYFAVAHPFRAKNAISVRRTLLLKLGVVIASVLINIPDFLRYDIGTIQCEAHSTCACGLLARPNPRWYHTTMAMAYSVLWHSLGTFLPCVILLFCNVRLVAEIRKSRMYSRHVGSATGGRRETTAITVILILIVSMFLLLVCPSMLLTFLTDCILQAAAPATIQHLQTAVIVTNLTQAVNFAINFLLYCAFSPKFRNEFISHQRTTSPPQGRYEVVKLV